jgi:hypothetical protein
MNRRVVTAGIGGVAIAAVSLGTAIAVPSHPSTRSWSFVFNAVQTAGHVYTHQFIGGDKDVDGAGKVIGTDTIQCNFSSNGSTGNCDVAASFKGGQVYGTFTQNFKTGALSGKVTGGTRTYNGAVGKISGHAVNNTTEHVSVTFQTP